MKKFLKGLIIIILIVAIILGAIIGYFYRQAQSYIQSSNIDTTIAITRTMKASFRERINTTANASLLQILQYSYDKLHAFNIQKQQNSALSIWEHTIKTQDTIVDIAIQIPGVVAAQIITQTTTGVDSITFQYGEQYLGSITLYTLSGWEQQQEIGVFNNEKLVEQDGYILAYAQVLDNPFTGIQLEAFGEIAAIFNTAISSIQIINIQEIEKILGYITDIQIEDNGDRRITIDPIVMLTGEDAAKALAEYEPELCQSILSGTDETLCFPPNDFYILNETPDDSITLTPIADEGMQMVVELIDATVSTQATRAIPETLRDNREAKYKETLFHIHTIDDYIIQITEQYLP